MSSLNKFRKLAISHLLRSRVGLARAGQLLSGALDSKPWTRDLVRSRLGSGYYLPSPLAFASLDLQILGKYRPKLDIGYTYMPGDGGEIKQRTLDLYRNGLLKNDWRNHVSLLDRLGILKRDEWAAKQISESTAPLLREAVELYDRSLLDRMPPKGILLDRISTKGMTLAPSLKDIAPYFLQESSPGFWQMRKWINRNAPTPLPILEAWASHVRSDRPWYAKLRTFPQRASDAGVIPPYRRQAVQGKTKSQTPNTAISQDNDLPEKQKNTIGLSLRRLGVELGTTQNQDLLQSSSTRGGGGGTKNQVTDSTGQQVTGTGEGTNLSTNLQAIRNRFTITYPLLEHAAGNATSITLKLPIRQRLLDMGGEEKNIAKQIKDLNKRIQIYLILLANTTLSDVITLLNRRLKKLKENRDVLQNRGIELSDLLSGTSAVLNRRDILEAILNEDLAKLLRLTARMNVPGVTVDPKGVVSIAQEALGGGAQDSIHIKLDGTPRHAAGDDITIKPDGSSKYTLAGGTDNATRNITGNTAVVLTPLGTSQGELTSLQRLALRLKAWAPWLTGIGTGVGGYAIGAAGGSSELLQLRKMQQALAMQYASSNRSLWLHLFGVDPVQLQNRYRRFLLSMGWTKELVDKAAKGFVAAG